MAGSIIGTDPRITSPVEPLMVIRSPSLTVVPLTEKSRLVRSTFRLSAPATQGLPMPRATTAAWLVLPPRAVRTPLAAIMPWTSSGLVSMRTRMTASPFFAIASAPVGVEDGLAAGGAGRGVEASGDDFWLRLGIDAGMQKLIDLGRLDPLDGLVLEDHFLAHHVDGDFDGRRGRSLGRAGLQHPELLLLDRELDVLDVAVVLLQLVRGLFELAVDLGNCFFRDAIGWGVRIPATTSSPCALIR